jgi:hypothetical protein
VFVKSCPHVTVKTDVLFSVVRIFVLSMAGQSRARVPVVGTERIVLVLVPVADAQMAVAVVIMV